MTKVINGSDVIFSVNGQTMGSLQPVEVEYSREKTINKGDDLHFISRSYSGTLNDIEIGVDFANTFISSTAKYTVVSTGYKFPRGNKLPKKKRLRKKWLKKYVHEFKLDNCTIV